MGSAASSSGGRAAEPDAKGPPPEPEQTCYRLRRCRAFWATFVQCAFVMSVLTTGYRLPWAAGPPLPTRLPNHSSAEQHAAYVTSAIEALLAKGAIAVAACPPLFVSPLSVVERRGKLRLVLDLSCLNGYLTPPPRFKYETIGTAAEVFAPGDYTFSTDLEAAYHHVDMDPSAWPYLGLCWQGTYYVFKVRRGRRGSPRFGLRRCAARRTGYGPSNARQRSRRAPAWPQAAGRSPAQPYARGPDCRCCHSGCRQPAGCSPKSPES